MSWYVWDGENIAAELEIGREAVYYQRGIGLIAAESGNGSEYYLKNGHGDVTGVYSTQTNSLKKSYAYDPFGSIVNPENINEILPEDPNDTNPYRYAGEYYDRETGNYYLRARYYAPSYGRFTQIDPIRDGTNWYIYCDNDPVNKIDPSGMVPYEKFWTIEEALLDFAWNNFGKSNYVLIEFGASIMKGYEFDRDYYYYTWSVYGNAHGVDLSQTTKWYNAGEWLAATVHIHPHTDKFSGDDTTSAIHRGVDSYIVTPDRNIRKGKVVGGVFTDIGFIAYNVPYERLSNSRKRELRDKFESVWKNHWDNTMYPCECKNKKWPND